MAYDFLFLKCLRFVLVTLIAGAVSLVIYVIRQSQLEKPMLDFGVYKYPMFSLSSAISITMNLALFSGMLLMPNKCIR